jgi:hypothetical protein
VNLNKLERRSKMKIIKLENGLFKMKFNNAEVTLNATDTLAGAWDSYIQLQKFFSEINAAKSETTKSKAPVKVEPTAEPKSKEKTGRTEIMFDLLAHHETLTPYEMMEKAGLKDDNLKFWSSIALRAVQAKKLKRRKLKDGGFTYSLKPSKD